MIFKLYVDGSIVDETIMKSINHSCTIKNIYRDSDFMIFDLICAFEIDRKMLMKSINAKPFHSETDIIIRVG
ncbi:tRNA methyltransferase [Pectobacterium phage POP12]|nr:tRNA methyltransferase [Pectobacterium phage POP12]